MTTAGLLPCNLYHGPLPLPSLQSTYRKCCSNETALLKTFTNQMDVLNNVTCLLRSTLSIMTSFSYWASVCRTTYGIHFVALDWISSYIGALLSSQWSSSWFWSFYCCYFCCSPLRSVRLLRDRPNLHNTPMPTTYSCTHLAHFDDCVSTQAASHGKRS